MAFGRGEKRVPKGRLTRLTNLGRLAAGLATDLAGAAGRVATGGSRDEAAERFHRGAAERLANVLGRMKGLPMKVGQMLSYIDDFIPPNYRAIYGDTLRRLQVKAHPMRWKEIHEVVQKDLGRGPDEVFAEFDRTPIAAASIGQVYRAKTREGREVAVKVQYPGIAEAIQADLKNIDLLRSALSVILPKVDVERSLEDITARVLEECDYGCELNNQLEFRRIWKGDPEVVVPDAFPDLSGDHVLVTEYVAGLDWESMRAASAPDERARYGRTLYRFVFRSLHVFGMFNGDPHPGNYLFPGGGRVAFLDFGCVQRFEERTVDAFAEVRRMAMEGVRGEPFRDAMRRGYGFPDDLDEEEWSFLEEYLLLLFEPVLVDGFRFDRRYTERIYDLTLKGSFMGARKAVKKGIWEAKQPGLVFLNRIQYGLYSVLSTLEAHGDWRHIAGEIDEESAARREAEAE